MAAQHTPGPWRVFTTVEGSKVIGIGERTGDGIADCGFGVWRGGSDEALANAHLMAAAPDMLAVLQRVERRIDDGGAVGTPTLTAIREAIAKAEGRS